jgi:hypothetical protein
MISVIKMIYYEMSHTQQCHFHLPMPMPMPMPCQEYSGGRERTWTQLLVDCSLLFCIITSIYYLLVKNIITIYIIN